MKFPQNFQIKTLVYCLTWRNKFWVHNPSHFKETDVDSFLGSFGSPLIGRMVETGTLLSEHPLFPLNLLIASVPLGRHRWALSWRLQGILCKSMHLSLSAQLSPPWHMRSQLHCPAGNFGAPPALPTQCCSPETLLKNAGLHPSSLSYLKGHCFLWPTLQCPENWLFHIFCRDVHCFREESISSPCYSIVPRGGGSYFLCHWASQACTHIVYCLLYLTSLTQHYVSSSHVVAGISSLLFCLLFCPLLFPPTMI